MIARLKLIMHFSILTKILVSAVGSMTAVKIARRDLGAPSLVIMTRDFT